MSEIKYPIALHKSTGNLVGVKDAENGINCNCICFSCRGEMVAINKGIIKEHHFRHHSTSNCSATYEHYIHWLSKEVFKSLDYIILPPIYADKLDFEDNLIYSKAVNKELRSYNFKKAELIDNSRRILLQEEQKLEISDFLIEKEFKSEIGNIIADIVLKFGKVELIIEPFFTNEIDELKFKKLKYIDKTTISLNLIDFINDKSHIFELEDFKKYIRDEIDNKEWIYFRKNKKEKLEKIYLTKFSKTLQESQKEKEIYLENIIVVDELENKKIQLIIKQEELNEELNEIEDLIKHHQRISTEAFVSIINHLEK